MSNFKRSTNSTDEFMPAKYWINLGVTLPDGRVVTLPVGIPLAKDAKGKGAEQSALVTAVMEMAASVPSGEQQELQGLKLFVRHVSTEAPAAIDLGLKLKLK